MLNFNYKKRLNLDELLQKIDDINNFENNEDNLEYIINEKLEK